MHGCCRIAQVLFARHDWSGLLRVIAGTVKGHPLIAPKGFKTRPTSDRVKESLFSILGARVEAARVLDLYAGTGSLAIEALSRGAASATLVEADRRAADSIERNLASTRLADKATLVNSDVADALGRLVRADQAFDLIFLDPPYKIDEAELESVLEKTAECLNDRGIVVLEHRPSLSEPAVSRLEPVDKRRYGDTALSLYNRRDF